MGFDLTKILPNKVCCCCLDFDLGIKLILFPIIILRSICIVMGCFYGPYLYAVFPLGGLYLALDILLAYVLFGVGNCASPGKYKSDHKQIPNEETEDVQENDTKKRGCPFPSQKYWIIIWLVMDILAIIGLMVGLGFFLDLGFWSMSMDPLHIPMFSLTLLLLLFLIYGLFIFFALYVYLKEAYLQEIVSRHDTNEHAGLTQGGRRISI